MSRASWKEIFFWTPYVIGKTKCKKFSSAIKVCWLNFCHTCYTCLILSMAKYSWQPNMIEFHLNQKGHVICRQGVRVYPSTVAGCLHCAVPTWFIMRRAGRHSAKPPHPTGNWQLSRVCSGGGCTSDVTWLYLCPHRPDHYCNVLRWPCLVFIEKIFANFCVLIIN